MKKYVLLAAMAVMMLATGCIKKDAVRVYDVESLSVSMQGGPKINAVLSVNNSSGYNIKVLGMDLDVADFGGNDIARLVVDDEIFIPKRSVSSVLLPLKVSLTDPINGLRLLRNLENVTDRVMVTGSVTVRYGGIRKKYDFENIPLSNIIANFEGTHPSDMPKIIGGEKNI